MPAFIASAAVNLMTGSMALTPGEVAAVLLHPIFPALGEVAPDGALAIVWSLRLPRMVLAVITGASLGMAGTAMQGLFRNPLADPALIGVSSGGAMGAIIAIVVGSSLITPLPLTLHEAAVPLGALAGALGASALIYRLATFAGRTSVSTLLLVGIAVNAFAGALIGFALFFSSADDLRTFLFWTLGSLDRASWHELRFALVLAVPALIVLPFYGRPLNVLLLGESEAFHLGVRVQTLTRQVIFLAAGLAGVTVALAGTIAFVGLMVPHIMRLWLGPDHRRLFPASGIAGAVLLLLADTAARGLAPPSVLPIGILTALAGAPFFLFLLARRRRSIGV